MIEYPKINSLFIREMKGKRQLVEGQYAREEFPNIKRWTITEKVDGTNIRVCFDRREAVPVQFGGRTGQAQIPTSLFSRLQEIFSLQNMAKVFAGSDRIVLFGEGYGGSIQKGSYYREDPSFVLFDAFCGGFWLKRDTIIDIANLLGIDHAPLILRKDSRSPFGTFDWSIEQIVQYVKSNPESILAKKQGRMEGIVARTEPQIMFRKPPMISSDPIRYADYHIPVMFKLKCKDFD